MELSKDIIGRDVASYEFAVEGGKLREFCFAIGETNPIYTDSEAARKAGFEDRPAPPTFQTVLNFWGHPTFIQDMPSLGIDTDRLLHMKEEYEFQKPIYPGMKMQVRIYVKDVKIGKMNMVSFESLYKDEKGELCLKAEMSIVIRPEK